MAELLVAVLDGALGKLGSFAFEEACRAWGLTEDMKRLRDSWACIQPLVRQAAQQDVSDEVRMWQNNLRDIALDAEDVLDDFEYEGLRRQVESRKQMMEKVCDFFFFMLRVCDFFSCSNNPIALRFEMANRIKNINTRLEKIKDDAIYLMGQRLTVPGTHQPSQDAQYRVTRSFLDDPKVVGRENYVSEIVGMLINSGNKDVLSVIPIVGMAGLGKTTVAKLIYHDDRLEGHFAAKIWVCVSENFDVDRILMMCQEQLQVEHPARASSDAMIRKLQAKLGEKRYLLVLDDVWNEVRQKWESLKSSLLQINKTKGSKIIVTTRKERVASIMEALPSPPLGELSEEDCWSIFESEAFASGGPKKTPEFEFVAIGREIVKKCARVPLAAKVLGSMMNSKREKRDWELIQKGEIWNTQEGENQIMQVLKLSFDNLQSPSLKQCFAYCSILPKDSDIGKDVLIQLWMAQGFLQPSPKSDLEKEDLGNEYFNTLLGNSLVQEATKDKYGNYLNCKMHDLVHDLAESILRFGNWTSKLNKENDESEIQHLELGPTSEISEKCDTTKVRSLFLMDNSVLVDMLKFKGLHVLILNLRGIDKLPISIGKLKRLRSLDVSETRIKELPKSIGKLKRLRYLDVSRTEIEELPKSIGKLYHLQTLRLYGCYRLHELPNELKNLINLRHICSGYEKFKMPVGMEQLTCLRTLPYFCVGQEEGPRIGELGSLNKLGGKLTINNLERVKDGEEAKKANLSDKENIYELELSWDSQRESNNNDEHVLEGLQPHPNLKSLSIFGFGGDKFPSWMTTMNTNGSTSLSPLNNLVEITLHYCDKCEQLPALGQLPFLRELLIEEMSSVECIGREFYGTRNDGASGSSSTETTMVLFPALIEFTLRNMGNLREWEEAEVTPATGGGVVVFPRLEELSISKVSKLNFLAEGLFQHTKNLVNLTIEECPSLESFASVHGLTSLHRLEITKCDRLSSLPSGLESCKSLSILTIEECASLESFASVHGLTSLHRLEITKCDRLSSLPSGLESCKSLSILTIKECPSLESFASVHGLTSLHRLEITKCDRLSSLPSGLESCKSLSILTIEECPSLKSFASVHGLTSLHRLEITKCDRLSSLPSGLESCKSLSILTIEECPSLESFASVHGLTSLHQLKITKCDRLSSLPSGLESCKSLFHLTIDRCASLNSIASIHGLTSLHQLKITRCDRLSSLSSGLESCTSLEKLCVFECPSLESVPEELRELCNLRSLVIRDCGKLKCLPWEEGLRCFAQLKRLSIGGFCEELDSFPVNFRDVPEQLEALRLWGWPKLKSLPDQLQHLTALTVLSIVGFDGMEDLPEWLGKFSSLESLRIFKCENLADLPPPVAVRRLTKLRNLYIYKCPHLEEKWANKSSREQSEIFGVPIRTGNDFHYWLWQETEVR